MIGPPQPPQDALIGDVAQQGVFEDILVRPLEGRFIPPIDQLAPLQRGAISSNVPSPGSGTTNSTASSQNKRPTTDARCSVSRSPASRLSKRACNTPVSVAGVHGVHPPQPPATSPPPADHPFVNQHLDQFLHVEGLPSNGG